MKFSDVYRVKGDYAPAFDIEAEYNDEWTNYITNEVFEKNLIEVIRALDQKDPRKCQSVWMQGTFGTGKSISTAVIKELFWRDDIDDFIKRFESNQCRNFLKEFRGKGEKIFPVVMKGQYSISSVRDLGLTIQRQVKKALEENNIVVATKTDFDSTADEIDSGRLDWVLNSPEIKKIGNKQQILDDLKNKQDITVLRAIEEQLKKTSLILSGLDISQWLWEVADQLREQKIATKIMIYWDEFTSVVNSPGGSPILTEIQNIAEKTMAGGRVFLYIISHITPVNVEDFRAMSSDEQGKINARFLTIHYDMQPITTYHIINSAIDVVDEALSKELIKKNVEQNIEIMNTISSIARESDQPDTVKKKLVGLYPIHPFTAHSMTQMSTAIGQSERSIFIFLQNSKCGYQAFLGNDVYDGRYLTADSLWDFVTSEDVFGDISSTKFGAALEKYAYHCGSVEKYGCDHVRVFKIVLLLNLLHVNNMLGKLGIPSRDNVVLALSGTMGREQTLSLLEKLEKESILYAGSDGVYDFSGGGIPREHITVKKKELSPNYHDVTKIIVENEQGFKMRYLSSLRGDKFFRTIKCEILWAGANEEAIKRKIENMNNNRQSVNVVVFLFRGKCDNVPDEPDADSFRSKMKEWSGMYKNTFLIAAGEKPLGNQKYDQFLEWRAQQSIDNARKGELDLKIRKLLEDWLNALLSKSLNVTIAFRSSCTDVPFKEVPENIFVSAIPALFQYGFDRKVSTEMQWKLEKAKSSVEAVMGANDRDDLEQRLGIGAHNKLSSILKDSSENYIIDRNFKLMPGTDQNEPLAKLCTIVNELMERMKHQPTMNVGKELMFLGGSDYGYYQNKIHIVALSVAFRPYLDVMYRAGTTKKIDSLRMKDFIINLIQHISDEECHSDDLTVRSISDDERELVNILKKLFKFENADGLTDVRRQIRDKLNKECNSPLWSIKYYPDYNATSDVFVNLLNEVIVAAEDSIPEKTISTLINEYKNNNMETAKAMKNITSDVFVNVVKRVRGDQSNIDVIVGKVKADSSNDPAFWDESKTIEMITRWVPDTASHEDGQSPHHQWGGDNDTDGGGKAPRSTTQCRLEDYDSDLIKKAVIEITKNNKWLQDELIRIISRIK